MNVTSTTQGSGEFDDMWSELHPVGRHAGSGGYRRFAWTAEDAELRSWFAQQASARGLDLHVDRAGNQWAWWGDPDTAVANGRPGLAVGSHLDSVPDGGAFDGPLGVVSAFAALDVLRGRGFDPTSPIAVVQFADEEGARFGVGCCGSQLMTGALDPDRARSLRDADGVTMAEAMRRAGHDPAQVGADPETLQRVGTFVELHVEQGRGLIDVDRAVGVGSSIVPHGRWRLDVDGEANHAGTTKLDDRLDPMLNLARMTTTARTEARDRGCVATIGKLLVQPNATNAIASRIAVWLDARGPDEDEVRALVAAVAAAGGANLREESWSPATTFCSVLTAHVAALLGDAPVLLSGAGHDAGVLALAGVPTTMLFVRNPTGVSHSPAEHAEQDDCHAGVVALAAVIEDRTGR